MGERFRRHGRSILGPAFINGGSISLITDVRTSTSTKATTDVTGDIVLMRGSVLDVSSGGRIAQNGRFQLDAKGRPAGNGGNISLITEALATGYQDPNTGNVTVPSQLPPKGTPQLANVVMDGTILAFGFAQGGTFALASARRSASAGRRAATPASSTSRPASSPASASAASF